MTRTVYLNGGYCEVMEARVSIFDRGLLFADSIYEVVAVLDGMLVDFAGHMRRLRRSLGELDIADPLSEEQILDIHRELVNRNDIVEGLVYMQVTRGVAERDFVFPEDSAPTVFMFTQQKALTGDISQEQFKLKSVEDIRWARRDIKSTGLLAQVLARQHAREAGADEALMVKDGFVTEGGASTAYIVKAGALITRPLSSDLLAGVTRASLLTLASARGMRIDQRLCTLEEVYGADEAFITGASIFVRAVVAVDDHMIGDGAIGPVVQQLQQIYLTHARTTAV